MKLKNLILQYIEFKQSIGIDFESAAIILNAFCKAMGDIDVSRVKSEKVIAYLGPPTSYWHQKFKVIRAFYRYAISRDYVLSSPLPITIPKRPEPFPAYVYTAEEFHRLITGTAILESQRKQTNAITCRTLLQLLFNTGLRISEALSLTLDDVDLLENLLFVRDTKFFKSRMVPINSSLATFLGNYKTWRNELVQHDHSIFFVKRNGFALTKKCVHYAFRMLCDHVGIRREKEAHYQPRIHDIRHSFIVHRLVDWYRKGADVQHLLPHLSTYVGHIDISSTQRYLTMTSHLLAQANFRFEKYVFGEDNDNE